MGGVIAKTTRLKPLDQVTPDTTLRRCLTTFDMTLMGMGSMIGSGIYVMTGKVIKEQAGPGIVISFILAAVIVLMVAGCFTEFAARVHRTGSTYLYVYLSLGELPAFLLGFITICLCILGGATNARAWSGYLDSLFNQTISDFTRTHIAEWDVGAPIAEYPDFVAMVLVTMMTFIIAMGAKCSSWFTTLFALLNVLILGFVIVVGFLYADMSNWTSVDHGGFLPYGFTGVISGTAVCFWAFSGFEILSCAVEEARNPKRDLPIATVLSLVIVMVLYIGTTAALTIMTPYYNIDTSAPLPSAFAAKGLYWAQVVVSLGPLCGLTTTLMSSLYSFVRIAYKISEDGLLFEFLSRVNECSHVPVGSVVVCGVMMASVALCLDLSELINFSVILILLSYCLVCGGVIILRYRPPDKPRHSSSVSTCSLQGDISAEENFHGDGLHNNGFQGDDPSEQSVIKTNGQSLETHKSKGDHSDHRSKNIPQIDQSLSNQDDTQSQSPQEAHKDTDEVFHNLDADLNENNMETCDNHMTSRRSKHKQARDAADSSYVLSESVHQFSEMTNIAIRDSEGGGCIKSNCAWLWPCNVLSPGRWPCVSVFLMAALTLVGATVLVYHKDTLSQGNWWSVILFTVPVVLVPLILATIYAHHQNIKGLTLKMPCVPLIPSFCICTCIYLLVSTATVSNWIGCSVLICVGLVIYFTYSIRHSKLNVLGYQAIPISTLEGATVTLLDHMISEDEEYEDEEGDEL